jgi:hypothetical protein
VRESANQNQGGIVAHVRPDGEWSGIRRGDLTTLASVAAPGIAVSWKGTGAAARMSPPMFGDLDLLRRLPGHHDDDHYATDRS